MYHKVTNSIKISVTPVYLDDQSSPNDDLYMWAYYIRIENFGIEDIQLLSRHWIIIDSNGAKQEVKGAGVVGEQPLIRKNGGIFEYSSGTRLPTSSGIMYGSYQMLSGNAEIFDVEIPHFSLDIPNAAIYTIN